MTVIPARHPVATAWRSLLLAAALLSVVGWSVACTRGQTGGLQPATPARGVTLAAEVPREGLIILRSPTFR